MKKISIFVFLFLIVISGCVSPAKRNTSYNVRDSIVRDAKAYLGVKYVYGGTTPSGFDCSGFTQFIYRKNGVEIPRTVSEMQLKSKKTQNPKLGDIVVFDNPKHVGILIGNNKFVHASTTRGIVIDDLKESWYKKHLNGYYTFFF